jgi:hypothetical protein
MWLVKNKDEREFSGGKTDWEAAARIAEQCSGFEPDDEDEQTADEAVSCYNCRYRRWTAKSFCCLLPTP